jgi:hypothetical protein
MKELLKGRLGPAMTGFTAGLVTFGEAREAKKGTL